MMCIGVRRVMYCVRGVVWYTVHYFFFYPSLSSLHTFLSSSFLISYLYLSFPLLPPFHLLLPIHTQHIDPLFIPTSYSHLSSSPLLSPLLFTFPLLSPLLFTFPLFSSPLFSDSPPPSSPIHLSPLLLSPPLLPPSSPLPSSPLFSSPSCIDTVRWTAWMSTSKFRTT